MGKLGVAVCATVAAAALSACADTGGSFGWVGLYGRPDVWYDGYYGPYVSGYWGADMAFYYRDRTGRVMPDRAGHFRREAFAGARGYHAGREPSAQGRPSSGARPGGPGPRP